MQSYEIKCYSREYVQPRASNCTDVDWVKKDTSVSWNDANGD